jgi:hypothetical protein
MGIFVLGIHHSKLYQWSYGKMHSTRKWSSLSERCCGLPCMPWPVWSGRGIRQLRVLLTLALHVTVLLFVGEKRRRVR